MPKCPKAVPVRSLSRTGACAQIANVSDEGREHLFYVMFPHRDFLSRHARSLPGGTSCE